MVRKYVQIKMYYLLALDAAMVIFNELIASEMCKWVKTVSGIFLYIYEIISEARIPVFKCNWQHCDWHGKARYTVAFCPFYGHILWHHALG